MQLLKKVKHASTKNLKQSSLWACLLDLCLGAILFQGASSAAGWQVLMLALLNLEEEPQLSSFRSFPEESALWKKVKLL